jgi:hypothetical protein
MAYRDRTHRPRDFAEMMSIGRPFVLPLAVLALASSLWAGPAIAEEAKAVDGPGHGELAGFVATPQTAVGGNSTFVLAPNGAWFLVTSPHESGVRLIDVTNGITLRYLSKPGLDISALAISSDSKTVFARGVDGQVIAWEAATGQAAAPAPSIDFHDITRLRLSLQPDLVARYKLHAHFGDLAKYVDLALNATQEYALIGYIGDPRWNAF